MAEVDVTQAPWAFDNEDNHITLHGAPIFSVFRADDFPCIEDDERGEADMEYLAHAQAAVMLLNMVAATKEPTLGEAFRKMVIASQQKPAAEGLVAVLQECDEALRNYACHSGDAAPCIRTRSQCMEDCGKSAGDALLKVEAILATLTKGAEHG